MHGGLVGGGEAERPSLGGIKSAVLALPKVHRSDECHRDMPSGRTQRAYDLIAAFTVNFSKSNNFALTNVCKIAII